MAAIQENMETNDVQHIQPRQDQGNGHVDLGGRGQHPDAYNLGEKRGRDNSPTGDTPPHNNKRHDINNLNDEESELIEDHLRNFNIQTKNPGAMKACDYLDQKQNTFKEELTLIAKNTTKSQPGIIATLVNLTAKIIEHHGEMAGTIRNLEVRLIEHEKTIIKQNQIILNSNNTIKNNGATAAHAKKNSEKIQTIQSRKEAAKLITESGNNTLIMGLDFKKEINDRAEIIKAGLKDLTGNMKDRSKIAEVYKLSKDNVHPLGKTTKMNQQGLHHVPMVFKFPNSKAKLAGEKLLKENPKIQCLWQWPRECKTQTDAIKKQVFDDFPDVQRKIRPSTKNGNIIVSTRRNKDEVFKVVRQYRAPVLDCDLKDLNLPDLPEIINNTIEELTIDL